MGKVANLSFNKPFFSHFGVAYHLILNEKLELPEVDADMTMR
jgi:hypothetical protein